MTGTFRDEVRSFPLTSSQIDGLLAEDKMPVIVGGTNYYIQALLWDTLIAKGSSEKVINLLVVFCWRFGAQKKSGSWRWGGGGSL